MLQLVLGWPVRLVIVGMLIFSLFVDGSGYVYRFANHLPLTGNVQGLPPNFGGWQLYFHKGLDLAGGTHIDYQLTNFPSNQNRADVLQRTITVISKRVNSLGVSEPEIRGAGTNNDRITVDLAGVSADQAQKVIGAVNRLVYTKWVPDTKVTGGPEPGYKPAFTGLTGDNIQSATAVIDQNGIGWVVNVVFTSSGHNPARHRQLGGPRVCGQGLADIRHGLPCEGDTNYHLPKAAGRRRDPFRDRRRKRGHQRRR